MSAGKSFAAHWKSTDETMKIMELADSEIWHELTG
jgi:hypothetical protein